MEEIINNSNLKDLFTSDKFNFIEKLDSDIESSKELLEKTKKDKELMDSLLYYLDNYYSTDSLNSSQEGIKQYTKSIAELINYNIQILKATTEISNSIKQYIVDLLIKSDNNPQFDYSNEMYTFKNKIEEYSAMLEKSNPQVAENNKKIDDFFKYPEIQKYMKEFSLGGNTRTVATNISTESSSSFSTIEENNNTLLVSEKEKKVYLPYSKEEILEYMKQYPNKYTSFNDVVKNEFIFPSDIYLKHTLASRFRETYSLMRDREAKSIFESFKYALEIMFHYDLNPAIIAACKTQEQLENYIKCLENNTLDSFKDFTIRFEVNPLKV